MPNEIQQAYNNKTRSYDGKPGFTYWQNHSSYDIDVTVEPKTWQVKGQETVVYQNNSPDSLSYIILKTFPNHYKKGGPRAVSLPLADLTDGMKLMNLQINDSLVDINDKNRLKEWATFVKVNLYKPLLPGDSLTLSVEWETQIPLIYANRIGAYDDESAFMGYWYPQIAVYDDIDGWDTNEYLGSHEFYRDFADFDVKINVPESYWVWATGTLVNPEQVLSASEFKLYEQSYHSAENIIIKKGGEIKPFSYTQVTWHYNAKQVGDFAVGISSNFQWEASSVSLVSKSVHSNFVYPLGDGEPQHKLLSDQNKGLLYLSQQLPGIEFPYPEFTTFIGVNEFDGMEFPMMANNGFGTSAAKNALVTFHELAHTYFPMYVGINEVKYSWMEEGWALFLTNKFLEFMYEDGQEESLIKSYLFDSYESNAGKQWDSPLITPSSFYVNHRDMSLLSYRKPALLYMTLEDVLGDDLFQKCLAEYIQRWAEKRPTPYDFMFTINDVSKQNLDWLWQAWVFNYGVVDLAVKELNGSKLIIENPGRLPVPVYLKIVYQDGREIMIHKKANCWAAGNNTIEIEIDDSDKVSKVSLLSEQFPDTDKSNNVLMIKN